MADNKINNCPAVKPSIMGIKVLETPLVVNLPSDEMCLSCSLDYTPPIMLRDITVDGISIVDREDRAAHLKLGTGLSYSSEEGLSLSLTKASYINPRELSVGGQQDWQLLLLKDNNILGKTSIGDLDYSKLQVQEAEDLREVRVGDFIFIKD